MSDNLTGVDELVEFLRIALHYLIALLYAVSPAYKAKALNVKEKCVIPLDLTGCKLLANKGKEASGIGQSCQILGKCAVLDDVYQKKSLHVER